MDQIKKTNEEWKKELDANTYHITREAGTEAPFTGKYWDTTEDGKYMCSNCGQELFLSDTKYDAGCGWPSFYQAINNDTIESIRDISHGMIRTEVRCKRCGAHLGHVFDDGPKDKTGIRYCINSASLNFKKKNTPK
jgi:peptide-methionine (R)-S-oxide reductase